MEKNQIEGFVQNENSIWGFCSKWKEHMSVLFKMKRADEDFVQNKKADEGFLENEKSRWGFCSKWKASSKIFIVILLYFK